MAICPAATWRPVGNHGAEMEAHLGLVLHVQQGDNSLAGYFDDPASQVSATWWVSKAGVLEQYVDSDLEAWAQAAGNGTYNSVETEGFDTDPLTDAQIVALAKIYAWGHATYGWPLALAEAPGQSGFAWHGMGGVAWGDHPGCPGDLRRPQRQAVLDQLAGPPIMPVPPAPKEDVMQFLVQETANPDKAIAETVYMVAGADIFVVPNQWALSQIQWALDNIADPVAAGREPRSKVWAAPTGYHTAFHLVANTFPEPEPGPEPAP